MIIMKTQMHLKTVNVVVTADTKQQIEIDKFNEFDWGLYDEEIYGGRAAYVKDVKMRGKVTVFPSGKLICVGVGNIRQAAYELKHAVKLLVRNKLIKPCKIRPKVVNIVSCMQLLNPINLEHISARAFTTYNPEEFPGVIYHPENLASVSVIIFTSGKCVIAGAKNMNELRQAAERIKILVKGSSTKKRWKNNRR